MRGRKGKVEPKETASRRERERERERVWGTLQLHNLDIYIYIYLDRHQVTNDIRCARPRHYFSYYYQTELITQNFGRFHNSASKALTTFISPDVYHPIQSK